MITFRYFSEIYCFSTTGPFRGGEESNVMTTSCIWLSQISFEFNHKQLVVPTWYGEAITKNF